jgi:endonuclease III
MISGKTLPFMTAPYWSPVTDLGNLVNGRPAPRRSSAKAGPAEGLAHHAAAGPSPTLWSRMVSPPSRSSTPTTWGCGCSAAREQIGTSPEGILGAPESKLLGVTGHGILAETFAAKLRAAAAIAVELGNLEAIARGPLAQARRALRRFPGIAEPGADRILLFSRTHAVPALESNGSRALQRLGLVTAGGSYAQVHRAGTKLIATELGPNFDRLIETYQLLRRHGRELCRRSRPLCEGCPLRDGCAHYGGFLRRSSGLKP